MVLTSAAEPAASEPSPTGVPGPSGSLGPAAHAVRDELPALRPEMSTVVQELLAGHADLLDDLSYAFGGPVHMLFPAQFESNVGAFRDALSSRNVEGRVYFAKKANKAACWVEQCAALGIGVDVSSPGELREALGHGVCGPDITVTGPAKSEELLRLALLHRCLTAVDDLGELETFAGLAQSYGCGRILLRCLPSCQPSSRFGLDEDELALALGACREVDDHVALEGFSFHLSGYEVQPRADMAAELLDHCRKAQALGLHPGVISIGGGFAVNYVGPDAWDAWEQARRRQPASAFHGGKTFESFGGFYPYHSPVAGADMLGAILDATPAGERESLATLLGRDGVTLAVEPGRSLLDQAGLTVFRIQGMRVRDYGILTVDGTSLSLSEQWFNSEFLPDPVLVAAEPGAWQSGQSGAGNGGSGSSAAEEPFAACVGGATCLEVDMLSWRKVVFPRRPQVGDLLVYVNTAGYQMDSNESRFHDLALPAKVVVEHVEQRGGRARWRLDQHQR